MVTQLRPFAQEDKEFLLFKKCILIFIAFRFMTCKIFGAAFVSRTHAKSHANPASLRPILFFHVGGVN